MLERRAALFQRQQWLQPNLTSTSINDINKTIEDVLDSKTWPWEQLTKKVRDGDQFVAADWDTFHIMTEFKIGRKLECLKHGLIRRVG